MTTPRISLIIPTKDRARCLGELVTSLRSQSFPGWEAVVVDDGSSLEQLAQVRALVESDGRFTLIRRDTEPTGGGHCRNVGLRAARADLITYFDDDDLLSATCLESRVRAMDEAPDQDFIVFPYERFRVTPGDIPGRREVDASEAALDRYLRIDPPWHTGSAVWRRKFLDRLGGWNEQISSWQDWDLGLRALCMRPRCSARREPAFFVRVASDVHRNISGAWIPKNVRSWPVAIASVLPRLREAGLFDAARARLLGKLYLFVAERHVDIGDRAEAFRLWGAARREGLVSPAGWLAGWTLLAAHRVPPVRALARVIVNSLLAER